MTHTNIINAMLKLASKNTMFSQNYPKKLSLNEPKSNPGNVTEEAIALQIEPVPLLTAHLPLNTLVPKMNIEINGNNNNKVLNQPKISWRQQVEHFEIIMEEKYRKH